MTDFSSLTDEQLNRMDKHVLITIIKSLQLQLNTITSQLEFLTEQIALMNQRSFGRKTEQADQMHQLSLFEVFNEAEFFSDDSADPEVSEIVIPSYTRKPKTLREENLQGLPVRVYEHQLKKEELEKLFPNGYKELTPVVYKRLSIIPQTFLVDEHRVHQYTSRDNDGRIVKATRSPDLFRNSIATPSLVAAIINGKYSNHLPLDRQSRCYKDSGVNLETNTMANWMMRAAEVHLNILYEELHKFLTASGLIHADETPFEVIRDGRSAGNKSYMWVYCTGKSEKHPIVLYDYRSTRKTDHPLEFLRDYSGILVTDGYQVYHSLEKQKNDLRVAGCWVHTKRKYAELVKSTGIPELEGTIAAQGVKLISELFHLDGLYDKSTDKSRKDYRQRELSPKVDAYFAWVKKSIQTVPSGSNTYKALQYSLNQETYLRVFLDSSDVPMDNNTAERAIRPFTVGRKNWVNVDSIRGAEASAIMYSLVETAKANGLRVYDYLEYVLTELASHQDDTDRAFLADLLPWSEVVQKKCHNGKKE